MYKHRLLLWILASALFAVSLGGPTAAQSVSAVSAISDQPDTPFKLSTFEAEGTVRVGLVLGERVLDIAGASDHLASEPNALAPVESGNALDLTAQRQAEGSAQDADQPVSVSSRQVKLLEPAEPRRGNSSQPVREAPGVINVVDT